MNRLAALSLPLIVGLVLGCGGWESKDKTLRIAVIPKGTTHAFWKSVEAGAKKAAHEQNVRIIWQGPLKEDEAGQQRGLVEQFIVDRVSGIVLAPLDQNALVPAVRSATQKGIPVVIYDSALTGRPGKDFVSFVATDNHKGGTLAGEEMARLLGNKGKVVLLRYKEGHASTGAREAGFVEAIKKHPEMTFLVDNVFGGATASESQTAAMNLIDKLKEADGIFCPNESSTQGMLLALRQNGLAGKVKFVGFDSSTPLVAALQTGEINALVIQNPTKMGYEAVMAMVKHLRGQSVPATIDTGCALVTKQNLDEPRIKEMIGR